jgi:hypothetical protein
MQLHCMAWTMGGKPMEESESGVVSFMDMDSKRKVIQQVARDGVLQF